jgi:hypothetical protein
MRTTWLCLALVACYVPNPPSGVPCAPATAGESRCPSGQVCVTQGGVEVCTSPGGPAEPDAAIDSMPLPGDRDGDGVPDATDRCPGVSDPKQYDEDGDGLGDVCDPCPVSANNADGDGDGVGDDCDPNAGVVGDRLVRFEGFGGGIPTGWAKVGIWVADAGALSVSVGANVEATLTSPFTVDATSLLAAAFVAEGNIPVANAGFGVAHVAQAEGMLCGLLVNGGRAISQVDIDTDTPISGLPYAWAVQTAYITGQIRRGNRFDCYSVDPQGASRNIDVTTGEVPAQASIRLSSRGISGRFLWVLHVDSP